MINAISNTLNNIYPRKHIQFHVVTRALLSTLLVFSVYQAQAGYVNIGSGLSPADFSTFSTAWLPGINTARSSVRSPAAGGATWSIMGAGFTDVSTFDASHSGNTQSITSLGVTGFNAASYSTMIDNMLNLWAAPSDFSNLGQVTDGGVNAGASQASGGGLGDIRIAAWDLSSSNILAHAFQPGTEAIFGAGGTIAGDLHFDISREWVDNAADAVGNSDFDIYTVALHELGHSLGLNHSTVTGSVMEAIYGGSRRSLQPDDISGIQAIYGLAPVSISEPSTIALLFLGGLVMRRRILASIKTNY